MNNVFSIVCPIFNSKMTIERTILSVVNQTFLSWELILVDDGSIDDSRSICKKFVSDKIRYFYQDNKGPQIARIHGVQQSTGKYIIFLDSDDYLSPDALEKLNSYFLMYNPEFIFFQENYIENGQLIDKDLTQINFVENLVTNNEVIDRCFLNKNFGFGQCGGCFLRSLISENITETDFKVRYCEDILAGYLILKKTSHVLLVPDRLYYYVKRIDSKTNSVSVDDLFDQFQVFSYVFGDIYKNNPKKEGFLYALEGGLARVLFRYVEKAPKYVSYKIYKKKASYIRSQVIVKQFLFKYKFGSKRIKLSVLLFRLKFYFLCYYLNK